MPEIAVVSLQTDVRSFSFRTYENLQSWPVIKSMPCSVVVFSVKKKEKISTTDFPYERVASVPVQDGSKNKRSSKNICLMCSNVISSLLIAGNKYHSQSLYPLFHLIEMQFYEV